VAETAINMNQLI